MTTQTAPPRDDVLSTVADIRQLAEELELRYLVAGMSTDERWTLLKPRLVQLAAEIAQSATIDDRQRDELMFLRGLLRGSPANLN